MILPHAGAVYATTGGGTKTQCVSTLINFLNKSSAIGKSPLNFKQALEPNFCRVTLSNPTSMKPSPEIPLLLGVLTFIQ